jgi:HEPN domain-containing protein
MFDVEKQMAYWRSSAEEDMAVARELIAGKRVRHGLFFAHLALEKALKAIVCKVIKNDPPRIHNLVRLSELADIHPTPDDMDTLADMNVFNLEGRYPQTLPSQPTKVELRDLLSRAEEVFRWSMNL